MAITMIGFALLVSMALLASIGMFQSFTDEWTRILIMFVAAVLWGFVGISAGDVQVVTSSGCCVQHYDMAIFFYSGLSFGIIIALFGIREMFAALYSETTGTDVEDILNQ